MATDEGGKRLKGDLALTRTRPQPRQAKSKKAITADILERILTTCKGDKLRRPSLIDLRDHAILLLGFASGGRRRSEIASLRFSQISFEDPVLADSEDPQSELLACATIRLGRTKTEDSSSYDNQVVIIGRAVTALKDWLQIANITEGAVFRAIDQWNNLKDRALTPQSINAILKTRIEKAGLDPKDYSAHGLRSGFLTEAAQRGIPIQDAMQQSRHRSLIQASAYSNQTNREKNRSARLLE